MLLTVKSNSKCLINGLKAYLPLFSTENIPLVDEIEERVTNLKLAIVDNLNMATYTSDAQRLWSNI